MLHRTRILSTLCTWTKTIQPVGVPSPSPSKNVRCLGNWIIGISNKRKFGTCLVRSVYQLPRTHFTYLTFLDEARAFPLDHFAIRQKRMNFQPPYLHHDPIYRGDRRKVALSDRYSVPTRVTFLLSMIGGPWVRGGTPPPNSRRQKSDEPKSDTRIWRIPLWSASIRCRYVPTTWYPLMCTPLHHYSPVPFHFFTTP